MKKHLFVFAAAILFSSAANTQTSNFSLQFDGIDDYVQFGTIDGLIGGGYTIEGWIRTNLLESRTVLNAYEDGIGPSVYIEVRSTGKLRFLHRNPAGLTGGSEIFSNKTIVDNKWHHFAAVRTDDGFLFLYIDGFLDVISCYSEDEISIPLSYELGRNSFAPSENFRHFKGYIDDIRVWDYPLTAEQIYLNRKKEKSGNEIGLFAYNKFDVNNSPCDIVDCSPNNQHGNRLGVNGTFNLPQYATSRPGLTNVDCGAGSCPPTFAKASDPNSTTEILFEDFQLTEDPDFKLQIVPNPAQNAIHISGMENLETAIRIFSESGKLISEMVSASNQSPIEVSNLAIGIYFITAENEIGEYKVGKFVKQ